MLSKNSEKLMVEKLWIEEETFIEKHSCVSGSNECFFIQPCVVITGPKPESQT